MNIELKTIYEKLMEEFMNRDIDLPLALFILTERKNGLLININKN